MGMENAYTKTPAEALRHFQVEEQKGLSAQQVKSAREKHGKNGTLGLVHELRAESAGPRTHARERVCV